MDGGVLGVGLFGGCLFQPGCSQFHKHHGTPSFDFRFYERVNHEHVDNFHFFRFLGESKCQLGLSGHAGVGPGLGDTSE